MDLLKSKGRLSPNDLMTLLDIGEGSVKHHLKVLQGKGRIEHPGPDKGGYWEVFE